MGMLHPPHAQQASLLRSDTPRLAVQGGSCSALVTLEAFGVGRVQGHRADPEPPSPRSVTASALLTSSEYRPIASMIAEASPLLLRSLTASSTPTLRRRNQDGSMCPRIDVCTIECSARGRGRAVGASSRVIVVQPPFRELTRGRNQKGHAPPVDVRRVTVSDRCGSGWPWRCNPVQSTERPAVRRQCVRSAATARSPSPVGTRRGTPRSRSHRPHGWN
ncbi:hypothetical protein NONO_c52900 [Nocardia nova SH22a]|uniref:Uncharacterized protein n=1 Tax=Nocardia nova SH22a TaxID=1415166 RepID=W5TL34_9NOCA|nr:hypothetical protein NONO_c52900 [Nocardia nova SH22a]